MSQETVIQIVKKFISELNLQLKDKGIDIVLDKQAVVWFAERGYDKKMGARPLARIIDNKIKSPLSRRVLFGDLVDGGRVNITIENDELAFSVEDIPKPLTKDEKKALKAQRMLELSKNEITENQED